MQAVYPYVHILHLFFAIIFLGYVFFDVIIFAKLKMQFGSDFDKTKMIITSRAIKIMPHCVLGLFITGGMMMSSWVGSKAGGFFETPLQQILMLKVALAFIIFFGVIYSLSCRALGKQPIEFMRLHFHKVVLILGFIIVLLAKLMFIM